MSLGGHNQEKKRHGNNTGGLDWGLNTRQIQLDSTQAGRIGASTQATPHVSNETTQSGRIGTSTRTIHRATEAEKKHSHSGKQPFSSSDVAIEPWPQVDRETRGTDNTALRRPPPCETCRRSAVATSYIIWQGGTTEPGPHVGRLTDAATKTQHTEASPHPPLDSSSL